MVAVVDAYGSNDIQVVYTEAAIVNHESCGS